MSRKLFLIGLLMLGLGLLGITTQAMAATIVVTIPTGAEACAPDYNSTCAFTPNPLTIDSGDSVQWIDASGSLHTAVSDGTPDDTLLRQPAAPENSFSTLLILPNTSSAMIGPFITAVMQTKLYHCGIHPATMKGTLVISPPGTTTTISGPTTTTTTTTIRPPTTTTSTTSTTLFGPTTTTSTTTTTTTTTSTTIPPPCGGSAGIFIGDPVSPLTPGLISMIPVTISFYPTRIAIMSASLSVSDNGAGGTIDPNSISFSFPFPAIGPPSYFASVNYTPPDPSPSSITLSLSGTVGFSRQDTPCTGTSISISSAKTFPVVLTDCNDQNNGKDKDKGKGHKGKCKGHNKDKN